VPTATDFDLASSRFDDAAAEVLATAVAFQPDRCGDAFQGGTFSAELELAVRTQARQCAELASSLEELATESRWRADQVRAYEATYDAWLSDCGQIERSQRTWDQAQRAAQADPSVPPPRGARPRLPAVPAKPYDWIEL
jgi:hypothetical protein